MIAPSKQVFHGTNTLGKAYQAMNIMKRLRNDRKRAGSIWIGSRTAWELCSFSRTDAQ